MPIITYQARAIQYRTTVLHSAEIGTKTFPITESCYPTKGEAQRACDSFIVDKGLSELNFDTFIREIHTND